jgi:hypothetical protein
MDRSELSSIELRRDKPYDEETVSHIRFPDGSIACIPHAPATEWAPLGNVVAVEAFKLHLAVRGIPAE